MGDRVSLAQQQTHFEDIGETYADIEKSIRFYYTAPSPEIRDAKFIGYTGPQMQTELQQRLDDLDKQCVLALLAAIEGSFRLDFHLRCQRRERDDVSRIFRQMYKDKGKKIAFEEDILETWKEHVSSAKPFLSELKHAFHYRHWLAHGRYWTPKFGKKHDFPSIYALAEELDRELQLLTSD